MSTALGFLFPQSGIELGKQSLFHVTTEVDMFAAQTHAPAPTRSTVHRLPHKRSRQQGHLLIRLALKQLKQEGPLFPRRDDDIVSARKF